MKIYKYKIDLNQRASIPRNAKLLSVGVQNDRIMVWALVDPSEPNIDYQFHVIGTGRPRPLPLDITDLPFLGTVFMKELVFHIFDVGPISL